MRLPKNIMVLSYKQNVNLKYKTEEIIEACAKEIIINEICYDKLKSMF